MMESKGQRLPADTESSTHVPLLHLVYGRLVSQTLHTNKWTTETLIIIGDIWFWSLQSGTIISDIYAH